MTWLPGLILMLRRHQETVLPALLKEASSIMPASLAALADWRPPWQSSPSPAMGSSPEEVATPSPAEAAVAALLAAWPATTDALARILGVEPAPASRPPGPQAPGPHEGKPGSARDLLLRYPATAVAMAGLLRT